MGESDTFAGELGVRGSELPRFGASLPIIEARLGSDRALGMLLVDAAVLSRIERGYGCEAHRRAVSSLGAVVVELLADQLGPDDLIASGETGRNEILVVMFREQPQSGLFRRELPDLARSLSEGLADRGYRVGYPHLKRALPMHVGSSAVLRNPTIGAVTQIRAAMEAARRDADLEAGLKARLRRREIFDVVMGGRVTSVYEPIVEVGSRVVFGYEALARGPEGTPLNSPTVLFEAAAEADLLFQLDCLCRISGIEGARDLPGGARLFLNVRPTTIHDPNFRGEALRRSLERCNLQPSDVVLEISEQESIGNYSIFREVRDAYGKLGFQFALDDTGAGYSSLEAVVELGPEFIKVDRAFVHDIDEDPARQELLRALVSLADRIGARIIGEGLDTLEELETLGRLDIPFGQGWLFGKPTPLRSDM